MRSLRHPCNVLFLAAAVSCGFVTFPASLAVAQDDVTTEIARERFKEGVRFFDQKQYEKARAAFLQAYALKKHPAVLLNLAQSELRAGHPADAAKHFSEYLRQSTDPSAPERAEAEKGLRAAKEQVAEIELVTDGPGWEVSVDGQSAGVTPLDGPLYLMPGPHTVEAKKAGEVARAEVDARAAETSRIVLRPASSADESASTNDADVLAAAEAVELDSSSDRQPFFKWFGETPGAWIGAGVTAIGIAGGIGFGVAARQKYDNANSIAALIREAAQSGMYDTSDPNAPCVNPTSDYELACTRYVERVDEGDRFKQLSIVSWVVAGVGAAGTVVYYLFDSKRERSRAVLVPVTGPGLAGISAIGEF